MFEHVVPTGGSGVEGGGTFRRVILLKEEGHCEDGSWAVGLASLTTCLLYAS